MRILTVFGPILMLWVEQPALAQTTSPPALPAPSAVSSESDASSHVSEDGAKAPGEESEDSVDPELAAAAAQDARERSSSSSGTFSTSSTSSASSQFQPVLPVVTPMTKLNPDMSFILNTGIGWFGRHEHIRQGGHAIDENGFALQALELAASASVDPYFRFDFYFQVQHLHLEEAFLTTLSLPANLQARAGYFNAAFGRQNPQHLHTWNYVNPPLMHTRFMSEEHFSGTGAEVSAILPLPWYSLLLVDAMTPSSATAFRSSTFATVEMNGSGRMDGLEDFLYVARLENFLELSEDWSLLLGGSAAFGQSPYVPDNRAALYGGDVYLKWRPLLRGGEFALALTVEAVLRDTQVPRDSVRDYGGYAQLDVQMSRRFMGGLRGDLTDLVRGAVPDPVKFPGQQARGSLSFTFLPTHFSKLRLQTDVSRVKPGGDPVFAFFLQAEVSAGEHGAHRF